MMLFKRVDTVFVPSVDMKRSEEWYKKVFGFRVAFRSEDGDYIGFRFDDPGTLHTGLSLYRVSSMPSGRAHIPFNFFCTNIDETRHHLDALGVTMSETETGGGMSYFDFQDPDGNLLGVVSFREAGSVEKIWGGRGAEALRHTTTRDGRETHDGKREPG